MSLVRFTFAALSALALSSSVTALWANTTQLAEGAVSSQTAWLTMLFMTGFAAVMWRNHRRVSRINRELRDVNDRLEQQMEASQSGQEIREALELRVARAERMESLGALAGGISHDFNNLLVGVVCNAQLLKRPELSEDARERCIDGILKSADKATDLSAKMRAYAGREPSARGAVDMVSLVKRLGPILRSGFMNGIPVAFEFESESLQAHVDEGQVETILMSLARNARDAIGTSSSGEVTIRVGSEAILNVADDSELIGERTNGGEFIFIEMEDSGCGISQDECGRIFEPFFTTKDGGRGMGLPVVYGLVKRQDGLIRCASKQGLGTKMRILLPKAKGTETARRIREAGQLAPHGKLLVIDDEASILEVVTQAFATLNWTTKAFLSGTEAIPFIKDNADSIDCILLDVVMPEMDGEAIAKKIGRLGLRIPIVIMSGHSSTNLNDFVKMPNVQATLSKPFSVADMAKAVSIATAQDQQNAASQNE